MRLGAFIIALLLLAGSIDQSRGWLIVLVVVTGLVAMRVHLWRPWRLRPAFDIRLAAFAIAALLLAGAIDPQRGWLIALTVITGLALVNPRAFSIDLFGINRHRVARRRTWAKHASDWLSREDSDDEWERWERHMDRRLRRAGARSGDDWS